MPTNLVWIGATDLYVIEQTGSSPGNCDLHVTIKIVYICMLDIVIQVILYMHECVQYVVA